MKNRFYFFALCAVLMAALSHQVVAQERPPLFEERFEGDFTTVPEEWNNDDAVGITRWRYVSGGVDGNGCVGYKNSSNSMVCKDYNLLVSPVVIVPGKGYSLKFDYFLAAEDAEFEVLFSTDGGTTWSSAGEMPANTAGRWKRAEYVMPAGDVTVGLMARMKEEKYNHVIDVMVDNVTVGLTSRCQYPDEVDVKEMTETEVKLTVLFAGVGATPKVVEYELYDAAGLLLRRDKATVDRFKTITIGNLEAGQVYSVRMRSDCTEELLGYSDWTSMMRIKTRCTAVAAGYVELFDVAGEALSPCWTVMYEGGERSLKNSSLYHVGTSGCALEVPSVSGGTGEWELTTGAIDHAVDDMQVSFYIRSVSGEMKFSVGVVYDGDFEPIVENVALESTEEWNKVVVHTDRSAFGDVKGAGVRVILTGGAIAQKFIDEFKVEALPTCVAPESVTLAGFTDVTAGLSWQSYDRYDVAEMNVYAVEGETNRLLGTVSKTDTVIEELTPDTKYTLKFKTKCGSAESEWAEDVVVFTTLPAPKSVPYGEDFESTELNKLPVGWSSSVQGVWCSVQNYQSTRSLILRKADQVSPNAYSAMISVPSTEGANYVAGFKMYRVSDTYSTDAIAFYANTTASMDGAIELGRANYAIQKEPVTDKAGWYKYEFNIPDALKGKNICLIMQYAGSYMQMYIDSVYVNVGDKCLAPTDLRVKEVDAESMTLAWTPAGDAAKWDVTVTYKTGTEAEQVVTKTGWTTPEITIEGLAASTQYSVTLSVTTDCGTDGKSKAAENTLTVTTPCVAENITSDDGFAENFDAVTNSQWPACWVHSGNSTATQIYNKQMKLNRLDVIGLPVMEFDDIDKYRLTFKYQGASGYGAPADGYPIEVGWWDNTDDAASFVAMDTVYGGKTSLVSRSVEFKDYTVRGKRLAFRYNGSGASYLDDIKVELLPACPDVKEVKVTRVSYDEADIEVECEGATRFNAVYGDKGFDPTTAGTWMNDVTAQFTITGLTGDKDYDVYVQAVCTTDKGALSNVATLHTLCTPYEVSVGNRMYDGFEATTVQNFGCWTTDSVTGCEVWKPLTYGNEVYKGKSAQFNPTKSAGEADLYYPVAFKRGATYQVSFYAKATTSGGDAKLTVAASASSTPDEDNVTVSNMLFVKSGEDYKKLTSTIIPTSDVDFLRIRATLDNKADRLYIDDVVVIDADCAVPELLEGAVRPYETRVEFQLPAHGIQYNIKVSKTQIDPATDEAEFVRENVTSRAVEIDGLTSNTVYYYYIQQVCGEGKVSEWTDEAMFRTECGAASVPFVAGFEAATDLDCWRVDGEGSAVLSTGWKSEGTQSVFLQTTASVTLASPQLTMPAGKKMEDLQIEAVLKTSEAGTSFSIGVAGDINDPATSIGLSEFTVEEAGEYRLHTYFSKLKEAGYEPYAEAKYITITADKNYFIDGVNVTVVDDCAVPANVQVKDITDATATVTWESYAGGDFRVILKDGNDTEVKSEVTTEHTFALTDLKMLTGYKVGVAVKCTVGDKAESDTVWTEFRTGCGVYGLPFGEDFEAYANGMMPDCWNDDIKSSAHTWNKWQVTAQEGRRIMSFQSNGTTNPIGNSCVLQTPQVKVESDMVLLSITSKTKTTPIQILVSTDGGRTFADTVDKELLTADWEEREYELKGYACKTIVVGIRAESHDGGAGVWIDEVRMYAEDCPRTATVEVKELQDGKAVLGITDAVANKWQVALCKAGERPETVTPVDATDKTVTVVVEEDTEYEVYVRSACDDGTHFSPWSLDAVRFTSLCPLRGLPFVEKFEDVKTFDELSCWETSMATQDNQQKIEITETASELLEGKRTMKITNSKYGSNVVLMLPEMKVKPQYVTMKFEARHTGYSGSVNVNFGVCTDGDMSSFDPMKTVTETNKKAEYTVAFAPGDAEHSNIAMRIPYCGYNALLIDSIVVTELDLYPAEDVSVSKIQATTATVTWRCGKPGAEGKYEYVVYKKGENYQTVTPVEVTDTKTDLTALTANTDYEVRVRTVGDGDVRSEWSKAAAFHTLSGDEWTLPYYTDFTGHDLTTWSRRGDARTGWTIATGAADGNAYAAFDGQKSVNARFATDTIISPMISVTEGQTLSFDYRENLGAQISVFVMDETGALTAVIKDVTDVPTWMTKVYSLEMFAGKKVRVVLAARSLGSNGERMAAVDNLRIGTVTEEKHEPVMLCRGEGYEVAPFAIPSELITEAVNEFSVVVENEDKTVTHHTITINVPKTDYYIEGYFETGKAYDGKGFEGLTQEGSDYVRTDKSVLTGCDSITHLNLTEVVTKYDYYKNICTDSSYVFFDKTYTTSGTFTHKEMVGGFEVVHTLYLNVLPKYTEFRDTVCEGEPYSFGGEIRYEGGDYTYNFKEDNSCGCDSIVTLHLAVIESEVHKDTTICRGGEIYVGGKYIDTEGEHRILLSDVSGKRCEQTLVLTVKFTEPVPVEYSTTLCEGYKLDYPGFAPVTITKDTVIEVTNESRVTGCDSVTRLTVEFVATARQSIEAEIEEGESYPFGKLGDLTKGGVYVDTLKTTETLCDSIVTLTLTVREKTGVDALYGESMSVYPNPVGAGETVYISTGLTEDEMRGAVLTVTDAVGRLVVRREVDSAVMAVDDMPVAGVYMLRVVTVDGKTYISKLIVE